ncbi:MAG: TolC family protein [Elusimicrobiales bacterium]|nr:TolC family protein [Elusimicrobiales bacterium]
MKGGLLAFLLLAAAPARLAAAAWTLDSYKAEVLRGSHDVKRAAEDAGTARGRYVSDLAAFWLPAVTVGASASPYSAYNSPRLRFYSSDITAGVTARLNLYNNFKDKLDLASSRAASRAGEYRLWQERQQAALDAMQAYYGVLRKRRLLEVVRNSLASYQTQYEKVLRYYKEGMKSYADLLKSEVSVHSGQLSEASALEDYTNAVMDLNLSVYLPPETEAELADVVSGSTAAVAGTGDVDYALEHRPELKVYRLELDRARLSARKALLDRFPDLSADAYYDRRGLGSWGRPAAGTVNPNYYLMLSLSLPLGAGTFSEKQASLEAETAAARASRALYNAELQVRREVLSARLALFTAVKRYEVSGLKAGVSRQSLEIVNSRYGEGRSGIVELADAQNDDLVAQSELANALYDLLLARARYDKAAGRQLW